MKRWLNSILFSLRMASKNMIRHPLRSFVIALSFLALVTALFLSLNMRQFLTTYFLGELEDTYQQSDVKVRIGQTGNTRFFTIRPFQDSLDRDRYVKDYAAFFSMDVLVEYDDQSLYVQSISSDLNQLSKITHIPESLTELSDDEILITESLGLKMNVDPSDVLTLTLAGDLRTYTIKAIINDYGLFRGDSVFMNKSGSLSFFLSALDPSLNSIPEYALINLYNELYVDLKEDITPSEFENWMRSIEGYHGLSIEPTINLQEINEQIDRNFSIFMFMTTIVIFAILLVLETSINVYVNDSKQTMAVIHILGGKPSLFYRNMMMEFSLYIALSLILGKWAAQSIVQYGIYYVGGTKIFRLTEGSTYIILAIIFVLLLMVMVKDYYQRQTKSSIGYMREEIILIKNQHKGHLIVLGIATFLYILTFFFPSYSSISIFRFTYALLLLIIIPVGLYSLLIKHKSETLTRLHLSMLYHTKAFRHYLFVMLISGVSVLLLGLILGHMEDRYEIHRQEFKIDYLMTNFVSAYEETLINVREMEGVKNADSIIIYENIVLLDSGDSIFQAVSISPDLIDTYFNYDFTDDSLSSLNQSIPTIILPNRFKEIYHLDIGDSIPIYVHPEATSVHMVIGGFYEKYLSNLAFTNLGSLDEYQDLGIQTIAITQDDTTPINLFEALIDTYSPRLIYIIDYRAQTETFVTRMERSTDYLALIIISMILCFVIAMFNHSLLMFGQMNKNYARMIALGLHRKKLILLLIKSGIVHYVIVLVSSMITFTVMAWHMTDVILVTGEYEKVHLMVYPYLLGTVLLFFLSGLVHVVNIYQVFKLNPSPTLRLYE